MKNDRYEFNGTWIEVRDNYVDLTALAKSGGKDIRFFDRDPGRKKFLEALARNVRICTLSDGSVPALMITRIGRGHRTWGLLPVARYVAIWCSGECAAWFFTHVSPEYDETLFRRDGVEPEQRSFVELEVEALTSPETVSNDPNHVSAINVRLAIDEIKREFRIFALDQQAMLQDALGKIEQAIVDGKQVERDLILAAEQLILDGAAWMAQQRNIIQAQARLEDGVKRALGVLFSAIAIWQVISADAKTFEAAAKRLRHVTRTPKASPIPDDGQWELF